MRPILIWACLALTVLAACADTRARGADVDPLSFDAAEIARADKIAIFVPGAFTSVAMFDATASWQDSGYARVFYRFPGFDGRPVSPPLDLERAAADVAAFANRHPNHEVALIGYSTGGPVALLAAPLIRGDRKLRVAAISPAMSFGGGLPTAVRGFSDFLSASARADSLAFRDVWVAYWQTLLYGRRGLSDPALAGRIAALTAQEMDDLVLPTRRLRRAQTADLATWTVPGDLDLSRIDTAFFIGLEDPVFSARQTLRLRDAVGGGPIYGYPQQGHLLFLTQPRVFDDILTFLES